MWGIIENGGVYMYVILGVSIVALAVFLERVSLLYFRLRLDVDRCIRNVMVPLEEADYRRALDECSRFERHPLGRILKAGLLRSDKRDREIELAMEEKIMRASQMVKARINYMTMFANISTLLGLLGTIMGLITAFEGVSGASAAMKQEILAQGISMAMFTTAFGLIVAIPCLVGFYVLNNRGDYLIEQFEEKALKLFNVLSALKRSRELQCQD
jgi:biopolymer transport protein ExbB